MKKRYWIPLTIVGAIWAWNSSLLATPPPKAQAKLLSHRGVHQTFHRHDLTNQTCTAARIDTPRHDLIENTPDSTRAAFNAGADVVEIDIHPTSDGRFVVFHDWTLDCRTNGTGVTRKQSLAELQSLDIGYGYTADNGETFPLRGQYVGAMLELADFMRKFPAKKFLINFKSDEPAEGPAFIRFLKENAEVENQIFAVYGGARPTEHVLAAHPGWLGYTKPQTKRCLIEYLAVGWTGIVPEPCKNRLVAIPANYSWALWGWPNRFQQRMVDAGSKIILLGPMGLDDPGSTGIDTLEQTSMIPTDFDGYVWTNRIELIGPHLKRSN